MSLARSPPRASSSQLRSVRWLCIGIPASFHVAQAGIFLAMDLPGYAAVSGASMLWFGACAALLWRGAAAAAMVGTWLEVLLHSAFLTWTFGPDSGYALYSFALVAVPFLVFTARQQGLRVALAVLGAVHIVVLHALVRGGRPQVAIDPTAFEWMFYGNVAGLSVGLFGIVSWFAHTTVQAQEEAARERERSEALLRNVLPDAIAARLKDGQQRIADQFDEVTVLFADIAGFTPLSATLDSARLLELLDQLFSAFDALADAHGLEKIKTIGDAYMVVGGLPEPLDDHTGAVARFALAMRDEVRRIAAASGVALDVRVGIHSGPVVAGVIGARKFAYDLWGDTVNTASRMESHSEVGRIQVTEAVAEALKGRFALEARGVIEVKGKGPLPTWFLGEALDG